MSDKFSKTALALALLFCGCVCHIENYTAVTYLLHLNFDMKYFAASSHTLSFNYSSLIVYPNSTSPERTVFKNRYLDGVWRGQWRVTNQSVAQVLSLLNTE